METMKKDDGFSMTWRMVDNVPTDIKTRRYLFRFDRRFWLWPKVLWDRTTQRAFFRLWKASKRQTSEPS